MSKKGAFRARRMTPAEVEFDVTDASQVASLLARHDGPVRSFGLEVSDQPEAPLFVSSLGTLSVRPR